MQRTPVLERENLGRVHELSLRDENFFVIEDSPQTNPKSSHHLIYQPVDWVAQSV
jgi:hypothetical protein